jgi:hypothetical protein
LIVPVARLDPSRASGIATAAETTARNVTIAPATSHFRREPGLARGVGGRRRAGRRRRDRRHSAAVRHREHVVLAQDRALDSSQPGAWLKTELLDEVAARLAIDL